MKTIREIFFVVIVGLMFVVLVGQFCALSTSNPTVIIHYEPIPSAREIQRRLKDLDNPRCDPGKIDGIPGPNTITAWDNLIEDRFAIRAIEGTEQ